MSNKSSDNNIQQMENFFNGKRALVTGASKGIGLGIALALAKQKAQVIGIARNASPLLEAAKTEGLEQFVTAINCDLSDWDATRSTVEKLGDIDLLVNNAGTNIPMPFLEVTSEAYNTVFDLNLKAVFNISQIVAKNLISRETAGSIVHVSSQASQRAIFGRSVYTASKSGLDGLCKSMALELGCHKIRVNCVNPTLVQTDLAKKVFDNPAELTARLSRIPLGRFCEINEVASVVLFLLSNESSMITGTCLPVEGGMWAA